MTENKEKNANPTGPFPAMEEEVLNFWEKGKIFEKSVLKNAPRGDYVFYDGPPFATGTPHYGHIVASTMKDAVPRYWTMRGYRVERKWGWDCHGLPIENIAEKELGITRKKEIEEKLGVEKFNEICRSKVLGYVEDWKKIIKRLGRWADMENPYKTMDISFMESVWWVFKELWDKGLIYEGYRSMHICPRCETTLSQQEVAEGYKIIKDISAIAKFKLEGERKTIYILAWTTTPWTLIANVALAIGEDIDYVEIEHEKGNLILAKAKINDVIDGEYKILREFKGKELIGRKYKPLFPYYTKQRDSVPLKGAEFPNLENGWKIYPADFVTTEEGTGVVHIAPAFGEDDMNLGKKFNLPFVQHVGMDGRIKEEAKGFAGMDVKHIENHQKTDIEIIKYLAHHQSLFAKGKYEHSYPHCWRCETPLLNYATSSWFVNVTKIKKRAIELAEKINWSPTHIKEGRFGNWLKGARDWSISRQRFWASVIPIWKCDHCGEMKVFGSVAELEKISGEKISDLHKHVVDKITFKCEKCDGEMKRVPDVLDTWFDSGSMPYAQMHYPFENKKRFEENFPAEFIAEGVDQTRAWFYYLHVVSTSVMDADAYKNVIVNGIVLAEDGKKMSKRLQNYPDPALMFDKYGADSMRFYLLSSPVMFAENLNFSEEGVKEILRKDIMILWNVYKFYEMFALIPDQASPQPSPSQERESLEAVPENILDKWILARLAELERETTASMNNYDLPRATRPIENFIDDLSTWYLRRSRERFKTVETQNSVSLPADKQAALATLKYVLTDLARAMAPFTPFIAETLWQKVTGNNFQDENKSVHLENWPEAEIEENEEEKEILEKMRLTRKIVELSLAKRDEAGIKVRQPLQKLKIKNLKLRIEEEYLNLIEDEVNVKEVDFIKGDNDIPVVEIDTNITDELKVEGVKRDLVRFINALRKDAGMTIRDRVEVFWQSESELVKKVFAQFGEEIMRDTLSDKIGKGEGGDFKKEAKIEGEAVKLGIKK